MPSYIVTTEKHMQHPDPGTPAALPRYDRGGAVRPGKSATGSGAISLGLSAVALVSAPMLVIPYVGFLPALLAGGGIAVAWSGLRGSTRGTGMAVAGLVVSVVFFALFAGVATFWNVVVAGPAVTDEWFLDGLRQAWDRLFGS